MDKKIVKMFKKEFLTAWYLIIKWSQKQKQETIVLKFWMEKYIKTQRT